MTGETNVIANEIHLFEATIKSVNTAPTEVTGEIFGYASMFEPFEIEPIENPVLAFKATSDPDTMYHHQAMRQPDRQEFKMRWT